MNRVNLKKRAKNSLKGMYIDSIGILFLYFFIAFFASFLVVILGSEQTSFLSLIVSLIINGLFTFGYYNFQLKVSRDEEVTYQELFAKTSMFWKSIFLYIVSGIFTFLWTLLFIIPGIIASLNYSMIYFVALDNPELRTLEIISKSKEIMRGHRLEYIILNFSFLGWIIFGLFTFGLLYLWLIPYTQVTLANFYNEIKD